MENVIEKIKQTTRLQQEPPKYVLVLHLNPDCPPLTIYIVAHVMHEHLGMNEADSIRIMRQARRERKANIKPVTKDVGESLIHDVETCAMHAGNPHFKIALEQQ